MFYWQLIFLSVKKSTKGFKARATFYHATIALRIPSAKEYVNKLTIPEFCSQLRVTSAQCSKTKTCIHIVTTMCE